MAQDFIARVGGRMVRIFSLVVSAGAGSSGAIPCGDAAGKLDPSWIPALTGANVTATADETISAGNLVSLVNASGVLHCRKADNVAVGKEALGFSIAGITNGAPGVVWMPGNILTGLSSLTPGAYYWLSTAGAITVTAPTTAGNVSQCVGWAVSTTSLFFLPEYPVTM